MHLASDYATLNPMEQVPCLEFHNALTQSSEHLTQSMAIMEFLDEAFPEGAKLLPRDPVQRARAREVCLNHVLIL